jgi:hypothetical protein
MVKLLLLLSMLLAFAPTSASATLRTSWIANANYVYGPDDPSSVGHNSPIGTICSSDGAFGLALIVDTSATSYLYHYVGGNGTANLVLTEKPTDFIYNNVHWTSNYTTAPTTTVQTGAGTTGTCTVAHATDNAGQVTITPGGTGIAAGAQCFIVFNASYAVAPICQITAAAAVDLTDVISPYVTSTTDHLVMNFNTAPTTAHVYVYNYQCIETQ